MSRGPGTPASDDALRGGYVPGAVTLANYDVAPNGADVLMVVANTSPSPTAI
ncbi:MAG TPA: hypothetical protein VNJ03_17830 [Vicinamibacterales bacterium]|nr:hypothetical protein [Vicinamibacterales bacterium]